MKKIMLYAGVLILCTFNMLLLGKEDEKPDETKSGTKCDLKNVQNFYCCEMENNRMLKGFKCPVCEKGKCKWYLKQSAELKMTAPPKTLEATPSKSQMDACVEGEQKLDDHVKTDCYFGINQFIDNGCKCPCCGATPKDMIELDFINKNKCLFCNLAKLGKKEFCVKWIYGCPDGHKDILAPAEYKGLCPAVIKDAKGKMVVCKKKLDKLEVSIVEITYNYVCPACKQTLESPGKCQSCNKDLVKTRICPKSCQFPHVDEIEWEKQQKAKWEELKKEGEDKK